MKSIAMCHIATIGQQGDISSLSCRGFPILYLLYRSSSFCNPPHTPSAPSGSGGVLATNPRLPWLPWLMPGNSVYHLKQKMNILT